ncbi:MAG: HlyC/CorC family transporter [Marinilabiliales bacterium]|nr:MAG: HlyC/CorC family transporter [Marinilabiliales bacterium]
MSALAIILVSLLFSAFFSGMEIAFISSNKLRLELEKKQGTLTSRVTSMFARNPGQYIATMLVGNNIALVVYGITMAMILEPWLQMFISSEFSVFLIQTVIATIIILITAEFLPKAVFRLKPNLILNALSVPVMFFYIVLYPVSKSIIGIGNFLMKYVLGTDMSNDDKRNVFGKVDLDHFVRESHSELKEENNVRSDIKLFQNALDFSTVKLRECMVPRPEIAAFEINRPLEEIKQSFIETGYARILIYKKTIDNIIGYINSKDFFKNPGSIRSMLNRIIIVPETMVAHKLLSLFIKEKKSVAVVVDEFGGTAGMVTIEDIMEEIFGEIEDEHDTVDLEEKQLSENEYVFSGRHEIDYLNEKYNLGIPKTDDYETLAGFIIYHHESIPKTNQKLEIAPFTFEILRMSRTRIELVNIKREVDR